MLRADIARTIKQAAEKVLSLYLIECLNKLSTDDAKGELKSFAALGIRWPNAFCFTDTTGLTRFRGRMDEARNQRLGIDFDGFERLRV